MLLDLYSSLSQIRAESVIHCTHEINSYFQAQHNTSSCCFCFLLHGQRQFERQTQHSASALLSRGLNLDLNSILDCLLVDPVECRVACSSI